jgi:hypothetical protein
MWEIPTVAWDLFISCVTGLFLKILRNSFQKSMKINYSINKTRKIELVLIDCFSILQSALAASGGCFKNGISMFHFRISGLRYRRCSTVYKSKTNHKHSCSISTFNIFHFGFSYFWCLRDRMTSVVQLVANCDRDFFSCRWLSNIEKCRDRDPDAEKPKKKMLIKQQMNMYLYLSLPPCEISKTSNLCLATKNMKLFLLIT